MPFPESPRVIYGKNPLAEVICQLKFPPILRIDSEPPASFQEHIRADYPRYADRSEAALGVPPNVPAELIRVIQSVAPRRISGSHEFGSGDSTWTVSLARDFIALKTTDYRRWEGFRTRMERLLAALTNEYQPSFFTRVGLRYIDVIRRSDLGLGELPWSELLNPHIAGEFASSDIVNEIEQAARQTLLRIDEHGGLVMIRHGLATAEVDDEPCFLIDADLFVEAERETINAINILDRFNQTAGRLFRWCIDKRLHAALEPEAVRD